jgi:aldehyde dehydrogenase (NAD+)
MDTTRTSASTLPNRDAPSRELVRMRKYFQSLATRPCSFRLQQLERLKQAVLKYDSDIASALLADLKKSPEESYATETGLLLAEIHEAMANLRHWMLPERASTNLVNFPSTSRIYHDPLGVVLIVAPWNYPFQLMLIPLVGAIAGGNCAVLKPSEFAPATAALIERIVQEIFAPEYIMVVQGDGAKVLPRLMEGFRFDHVFYTGGVQVGKEIYKMAAKDLVPVTLELGGKSPAVVEADADVKVAAKRIALGKYLNAGQTCVAPDYVLVHNQVKDQFVDMLWASVRDFFGSEARLSKSYGKIINEKRFDRLLGYLSEGRVIFGGDFDRSVLFLAPTLMDQVPLDASVMNEEIFGPILPVFGFEDMGQALGIIEQHPNPLAFYVFTSSLGNQNRWIESVAFGGGCVNNASWQFTNPNLPFGGIGYSGTGAYHGRYSFQTFTHAKPVMNTPTWIDPDIKYPPFQGKLKWFRWLIR